MDLVRYAFDTGSGTRDVFYRSGTSDINILNQIFSTLDYDYLKKLRRGDELRQSLAVLGEGRLPLIVDCGANFGASSVFLSCYVPNSRVIAIEPEASNYELLTHNAAGLAIECIHGAIASREGFVRLIDPSRRRNKASYQTELIDEDEQADEVVPAVSVNEIYARNSGECFPYIVKVDIEGAEAELFSANTEWVDRTPLIIVELHDWLLTRQGVSKNFLRCVSHLDRDFIHIGENVFSVKNGLMPSPPDVPSFW